MRLVRKKLKENKKRERKLKEKGFEKQKAVDMVLKSYKEIDEKRILERERNKNAK